MAFCLVFPALGFTHRSGYHPADVLFRMHSHGEAACSPHDLSSQTGQPRLILKLESSRGAEAFASLWGRTRKGSIGMSSVWTRAQCQVMRESRARVGELLLGGRIPLHTALELWAVMKQDAVTQGVDVMAGGSHGDQSESPWPCTSTASRYSVPSVGRPPFTSFTGSPPC